MVAVSSAPVAVAHRTPATSSAAAALHAAGADHFELDLRLIGDDVLVTHFLPLVRRVPLVQHDGWRFRVGRRDPPALTLAAARSLVPDTASLVLDLKDDRGDGSFALARRLCAEIDDPGRHVVASKDWTALTLLAGEGFRVWRTVDDDRRLGALLRYGCGDAHAVTIRKRYLLRPSTARALAQVAPVGSYVAWTVNDTGQAGALLDQGVGGLTTDDPAVLTLVAARRIHRN